MIPNIIWGRRMIPDWSLYADSETQPLGGAGERLRRANSISKNSLLKLRAALFAAARGRASCSPFKQARPSHHYNFAGAAPRRHRFRRGRALAGCTPGAALQIERGMYQAAKRGCMIAALDPGVSPYAPVRQPQR